MNAVTENQSFLRAKGDHGDLSWLPRIDPANLDLQGLFPAETKFLVTPATTVAPIEVHMAESSVRLTNPVAIPFAIGPWAGKLVLSSGTLERLMQSLGLSRMIARLSPRQRNILIEYALASELEHLEDRIGHPIRLGAEEAERSYDFIIPWVVDFDDFPRNAELHLDRRAALAVGRVMGRSNGPIGEVTDLLPFDLSICTGTQELSAREIAALVPGDVIMRREAPEIGHFALLGQHFRAAVTEEGGKYILAARWRSYHKNREAWMPTQTQSDADKMDDLHPLDELPVQLVFEVGRTDLPLGELRKLDEGSVLPIAPTTGNVVNIVANGRLIGTGDLVKIGAGLGIRIVRLSKNG